MSTQKNYRAQHLPPISKCSALLHAANFFGLPPNASRREAWMTFQEVTLFFASYCREHRLPPNATAAFFGVHRDCDSHEQAALFGAENLVEAYFASCATGGEA